VLEKVHSTWRMFIKSISSIIVLLTASSAFAVANSAVAPACPEYIRTGEVWSNGDNSKYWMDLPLDAYPVSTHTFYIRLMWLTVDTKNEKNRTKAYYLDLCEKGATYSISFVVSQSNSNTCTWVIRNALEPMHAIYRRSTTVNQWSRGTGIGTTTEVSYISF